MFKNYVPVSENIMKTLQDICLDCLGNNLRGNISCIVHCLATVNKEILLERLVFHDRLTPEYLPHITYNLFSPSLKRINFYGCSQVTDAVLQQLNSSGCRLTDITIRKCNSVTDSGLNYITRDQNSINYLELREMNNLTAKAFVFVNSPALKTVKIQNCVNIDTEAIQVLLKKSWAVEDLLLVSCSKLQSSVISFISQHLKHSLKVLNVRDLYSLKDSDLTELARNCPNLIRLNLHGCSYVTEESFKQVIKNCENLRDLDLSYCTGLQQNPASMCLLNLPQALCELSLVGVMIEDTVLITDALKRLSMLKSIRLCGIPAITDAVLDDVTSVIGGNLEKLDLSGFWLSPLTDDGILAISRYCTRLSFVGLSLLKQVTGTGILPLLKDPNRAQKLTVLQLSLPKLHPDVLYYISLNCRNLEELLLSGVTDVDDQFVTAIARCCFSLRELGLKACRQVTDIGVCALAQYCPLRSIDLSGIQSLTDCSIYALANGCPNLEEIYLNGCSNVSRTAIHFLVDSCNPRVFFEHRTPNLFRTCIA